MGQRAESIHSNSAKGGCKSEDESKIGESEGHFGLRECNFLDVILQALSSQMPL